MELELKITQLEFASPAPFPVLLSSTYLNKTALVIGAQQKSEVGNSLKLSYQQQDFQQIAGQLNYTSLPSVATYLINQNLALDVLIVVPAVLVNSKSKDEQLVFPVHCEVVDMEMLVCDLFNLESVTKTLSFEVSATSASLNEMLCAKDIKDNFGLKVQVELKVASDFLRLSRFQSGTFFANVFQLTQSLQQKGALYNFECCLGDLNFQLFGGRILPQVAPTALAGEQQSQPTLPEVGQFLETKITETDSLQFESFVHRGIFPDLKAFSGHVVSHLTQLQATLPIVQQQSTNAKDKKQKSNEPGPIKFAQEIFENFLFANHKLQRSGDVILIFTEELIQQISQTTVQLNVLVNLDPSLITKYEDLRTDPALAGKQKAPAAANTAFSMGLSGNYYSISRQLLLQTQTSEASISHTFYTQVEVQDFLTSKTKFEQSIYAKMPLIPFDPKVFGSDVNYIPANNEPLDPKAKKPDPKKNTFATYQDGSQNFMVSNPLLGIDVLVQKLSSAQFSVSNIEKIQLKMLPVYETYSKDPAIRDNVINVFFALFKLFHQLTIFANTTVQFPIFSCHFKLSQPLTVQYKKIELPQFNEFDHQFLECCPKELFKAETLLTNEEITQLKEKSIEQFQNKTQEFFQMLQTRYILASRTGHQELAAGQSLAELKQKKEKMAQRQYSLTGIKGKFQHLQSTVPAIKKECQVTQQSFKNQITAEGFCEILMRSNEELIYQAAQLGFSSLTDLINTIVSQVDSANVQLKQKNQIDFDKVQQILMEQLTTQLNRKSPVSRQEIKSPPQALGQLTPKRVTASVAPSLNRQNTEQFQEDVDINSIKHNLTEQERQIQAMISRAVQLAATGNLHFIEMAFEQANAVIAKQMSDFCPNGFDLETIVKNTRLSDFKKLMSILLISGYRLSQPHLIGDFDDIQRIRKFLKFPVGFICSVLELNNNQFQKYISSDVCMLVICQIKTEHLMIKYQNNDKLVEQFNYEDEDRSILQDLPEIQNVNFEFEMQPKQSFAAENMTTADETSPINTQVIAQVKVDRVVESKHRIRRSQDLPQTNQLEQNIANGSEKSFVILLKQIFSGSPEFSQNILNNFPIVTKDKWKQTDNKSDILANLNKGLLNIDDFKSILENINFPDVALKTNVFNTLLKTDMVATTDDTGKRIKAADSEALTKDISYNLSEIPLWILGAFLFILWQEKMVSARNIDQMIQENCTNEINKTWSDFKQKLDTELRSIEQQNHSGEISQESFNKSTVSLTNAKNTSSSYAFSKVVTANRGGKVLQKHVNYHHLMAVQEYLCSRTPDFSKQIPTLKSFQSEEKYMEYILNTVIPPFDGVLQDDVLTVIKEVCMFLSLAEWLVLRGETLISNIAIEKARQIINSNSSDYTNIQHQVIRLHILELRRLYYRQEYLQVLMYMDNLSAQSQLYPKLRQFAAFQLIKAQSLQQLLEKLESGTKYDYFDEMESYQIQRDICQCAFAAYLNSQKTIKSFNDFYQGSTCIGDAGFYDIEFGYGMIETMLSNMGLLQMIRQQYLSEEDLKLINGIEEEARTIKASEQFKNQSTADFLNSTLPQFIDDSAKHTDQDKQVSAQINTIFADRIIEDPDQNQPVKEKVPLNNVDFKQRKQLFRQLKYQEEQSSQEQLQKVENFSASSRPGPARTMVLEYREVSEEQVEKDRYKQTISLATSSKLLLEQAPGFGPSWALYSLVQLAMGNVAEARLSSSISTLMCPQAVETWIAWSACEMFNAIQSGSDFSMVEEFLSQIEAMGVQGSKSLFVWNEIKRIYQSSNK